MSTTTIRRCDFSGDLLVPGEEDRWGVLMVGKLERLEGSAEGAGRVVKGTPLDICPTCIAKIKGWKGAAA